MDQIEEISLGLQAAIVIDEDDIVSKYAINGLASRSLNAWFQAFSIATIFDVTTAESS
ncbi:MAG: hypothetical protein WAL52_22710 [Candidatus Sulfotelmatobacter sp.]